MGRLRSDELRYLRRIKIGLFSKFWPFVSWNDVIRELPQEIIELNTVDMEIRDEAHLAGFPGSMRCTMNPSRPRGNDSETSEACGVTAHYRRAKELVEVVTMQLKRRFPESRIYISNLSRCVAEDQRLFQSMLDELD